MPNRCTIQGCGNVPDSSKGIALHKVPYQGDLRPMPRKRRQLWIDFVRVKRRKVDVYGQNMSVCSEHFNPEDFTRRYHTKPSTPRLVRDEYGVVPIPTIQNPSEVRVMTTARQHQQVRSRPNLVSFKSFDAFTSLISTDCVLSISDPVVLIISLLLVE